MLIPASSLLLLPLNISTYERMRYNMTYYRVAMQSDQSQSWMWKSTVLISLDAVLDFLKLHQLVPGDRLRVFFSSSMEYLNEMLDRENQGLLSNSLTAEQLLNGSGHIDQLEMHLFESACCLHPYLGTAVASLMTAHLWQMQSQRIPHEERTSEQEISRLTAEMNGSADHYTAYHFILPASMPQLLAWARLLGKVQRGELEP